MSELAGKGCEIIVPFDERQPLKDIERSIITTYRKKIWVPFIKGINDYKLINENDKIAVCISGGKDSFLLAKCIEEIQRHGKFPFKAHYVCMNPGYKKEHLDNILENAKSISAACNMFCTSLLEKHRL